MPKLMKFDWVRNPFHAGYGAAFAVQFEAGMGAYTKGFAKEVEAYAKAHAPWDDRTGDARAGLTAEGQFRLTEYVIQLYHTVDYGIWLEVRWGGRYAVIAPTIQVMGNEFMSRIQMAMILRGLT